MYKDLFLIVLIIFFSLFVGQVFSTDKPHVYAAEGTTVAVDGNDVVTYFTEEEPVKGSTDHQTEYEGVTWYFASDENLQKFKDNPEKYLPQYKGYCVWAISNDELAAGLSEFPHVRDGKLYLLCSQGALDKFLKEPQKMIESANEKWPEISKEKKGWFSW